MIKRWYVGINRAVALVLGRLGMLGLLERRAPRSRLATWARSLFAIYDIEQLSRLDVPWWTFESADRVAAHLAAHPGARVFEWGSGASTLWLSKRAGSVHAVEHDPDWAGQLGKALPANVTLELIAAVVMDTPVVGSQKRGNARHDFQQYVDAIDRIEGEFDLIVIDGRAREACLIRAVPKLAVNGVIVFDNVDRRRYRDAMDNLGSRVTVTTTRGLTPALPYPTRTALLSLPSEPTQA